MDNTKYLESQIRLQLKIMRPLMESQPNQLFYIFKRSPEGRAIPIISSEINARIWEKFLETPISAEMSDDDIVKLWRDSIAKSDRLERLRANLKAKIRQTVKELNSLTDQLDELEY